MLFRLLLVTLAAHACLAAWVDPLQSIVKADGNLNPDNAHLAGWLNPEALVNLGDSQLLDGSSYSWTPAKGSLAAGSHVNGPMVKRNQANGFPVVRFINPTGNGAAIKLQAPAAASATIFIVARLDLASTSAAGVYQHLWQMGATAADVKGVAVSKEGKVLVGKIGDDTTPGPSANNAVASTGSINPGSWHIYALDATSAHHKAFVDGTANTPLASSATAFADLTHSNAAYGDGVYQIGNDETDANGALQGDIAEVVLYKVALSDEDKDRVGTYLARKYALSWNRMSTSGAVPDIFFGDNLAGLSVASAGAGISAGGTVLTITGAKLFPTDFVNNALHLSSLRVNIGRMPNLCSDPREVAPCSASNLQIPFATCSVASHNTAGNTPQEGTLVCTTPPGLGPGQDIIINWQGVSYVLSNWFKYADPIVRSVTPSLVSFTGGARITIQGNNFGPGTTWTTTTAGGATSEQQLIPAVEIYNRFGIRCQSVAYVSDSVLQCTVPPLAKVKQNVDTAQRTVTSSVIVDAMGARSQTWASGSTLKYSEVPSYFKCDNVGSDSISRSSCYSCCRSACVSEAFTLGNVAGGSTYSSCDSSCLGFCGFM